jgi:hypothetical protein
MPLEIGTLEIFDENNAVLKCVGVLLLMYFVKINF